MHNEILKSLKPYGTTLIVGGYVRDKILGVECDDIDLATNVPMETIEDIFNTTDIGKNKAFGILVIQYKGATYEIAQFRVDSKLSDGRRPNSTTQVKTFEEDAARRDFTINAMALTDDGDVIDHYNGIEDIKNKTIRTVGNPTRRFNEDYLRMLRAVRFAHKLNFKLDSLTSNAILAQSHHIKDIAPERIMKEIMKIASCPNFSKALLHLDRVCILKHIFPEVTEMKNFEHNPEHHPEGNVWGHTLAAIGAANSTNPYVNLAILFHDIGKTITYSPPHFYRKHEKEGQLIINKIATRMKWDNGLRDKCIHACTQHMKMHKTEDMKNSTLRKIVNHEYWPILRATSQADEKARMHLYNPNKWSDLNDRIKEITTQHPKPIKINGERVMDLLGIAPSPRLGEIIRITTDWMVDNNIKQDDKQSIDSFISQYKN